MKESDVRARAFAMPLTSPAYPVGPYRFVNREFLIITYRTDPQKLRELVPEPLQIEEPLVKFEFIRMPDFDGLRRLHRERPGDPGTFKGRRGGYSHCMFLDDHPPIAGGRELWGFPKKLAKPTLHDEIDTLAPPLSHSDRLPASASASLLAPSFLLRLCPVTSPRICECRTFRRASRLRTCALTLSSILTAPIPVLRTHAHHRRSTSASSCRSSPEPRRRPRV